MNRNFFKIMKFWDTVLNGTKVEIYCATDSDQAAMVEAGWFGAVVNGTYCLFYPEAGVLPVPGLQPGHEDDYWCVGVARHGNVVVVAICKRNVKRKKGGGGYGAALNY